ncbi:MAG: hypothetical protein HYT66_01125 [Candidatus Yanofskybacteria bacterium]|nr:hypothetical protein [Candidatus Yanofskybacteria bacterium]
MKIKAACIGTPDEVVVALSSTTFASWVLSDVVEDVLGVKNVLERPAEYYVQMADVGPAPKEGMMGVEVRLTGASRDGRTAKQFHTAARILHHIVQRTVEQALDIGERCQVYCVIMTDGEVETAPGSGKYSNNIEPDAVWVDGTKQSK